jgi:hypothetical protein
VDSDTRLSRQVAIRGLPEAFRADPVAEHDPLIGWGRKTLFWDEVRPDPEIEGIVGAVWGGLGRGLLTVRPAGALAARWQKSWERCHCAMSGRVP